MATAGLHGTAASTPMLTSALGRKEVGWTADTPLWESLHAPQPSKANTVWTPTGGNGLLVAHNLPQQAAARKQVPHTEVGAARGDQQRACREGGGQSDARAAEGRGRAALCPPPPSCNQACCQGPSPLCCLLPMPPLWARPLALGNCTSPHNRKEDRKRGEECHLRA